jgi:hypothetical protein
MRTRPEDGNCDTDAKAEYREKPATQITYEVAFVYCKHLTHVNAMSPCSGVSPNAKAAHNSPALLTFQNILTMRNITRLTKYSGKGPGAIPDKHD